MRWNVDNDTLVVLHANRWKVKYWTRHLHQNDEDVVQNKELEFDAYTLK